MKLQSTIISSFLLILYAGVLLHNTLPHTHTEEAVEHAATHQHHHSDGAHNHHQGSDEPDTEVPHSWLDFTSGFTHATLGINHFSDFTGASYSFVPSVILAILLFLGNRWPRLSQHRLVKPPDDSPDQRLQLFCLSAASRRGPPGCS